MSDAIQLKSENKEIVVNEMDKKNNIKDFKGKKIVRSLRKNMNPPKIPNIGYLRFKKERRPAILNEDPFLSIIKIKKILLTEWKQLPAFKKMEYLSTANQEQSSDKKNYAFNKTTLNNLKKNQVEAPIENENELKKGEPKNIDSYEIYRQVKVDELLRMREILNSRKKDINYLHNYLEQLNNSIKETNTKQNLKYILYEQQLKIFRCHFIDALSKVVLPSDVVRPTINTMDHFMLYVAAMILSGDCSHIMPFVKETLSHLELSLFWKLK